MLKISLICAGIMAFWASVINEESAQSILSGYNTMSEEKKKNVDFKGIAKLYRTVFFSIAAAMLIISVLSYFFANESLWIALLILVFCWGLLPLFFLTKKYDTNSYSKPQLIVNYSVMILMCVGGFVIAFLFFIDPEILID